MEHVSAISAFKFGFKTFFKNILFFMGASIVTALAAFVGAIINALVAYPFFIPLAKKSTGVHFSIDTIIPSVFSQFSLESALGFLGMLIFFFSFWLIQTMFIVGWCKIALDFKDKGISKISKIFVRPSLALKALWASILGTAIILLPWVLYILRFGPHRKSNLFITTITICLICLTVYFALKLVYILFFIADKQTGIIAAIKKSFGLAADGASRIFLFTLLMVAIGFVAAFTGGCLLLILSRFIMPLWRMTSFAGGFIGISSYILEFNIFATLLNIFLQSAWMIISLLGVAYLYRELERRQ